MDRLCCEEAFNKLNEFLDKELTAEEFKLVEEHLCLCKVCADEFKFEASMIEQIKVKLRKQPAMPPDFFKTLCSKIRECDQES